MRHARKQPSRQLLPVCLTLLCLAAPWPVRFMGPALAAATDDNPLTAEFAPPPLSYTSVFTHYLPYREEAITSWPEANDTVGRLGGWRYYLEEAAEPDPSAAAAPTVSPPAPLPGEAPHPAGHGGRP